jgi:hypothetical protein
VANRDNHYEAAFEEYLRARRMPYVAVDEARRARIAEGSLKSLDFIVSPDGGAPWLVDVKGRRFPSGEQKQYWKNWSTRDDLRSLGQWQRLFGGGQSGGGALGGEQVDHGRFGGEKFAGGKLGGGLFVFAYRIVGDRAPLDRDRLFEHHAGLYGFVGIRLDEYAAHARPISPRWDTVAMPTALFRQMAAPVEAFF